MRTSIGRFVLIALIAVLGICDRAGATPITYSINVDLGTEDVAGTITTDGTLGSLSLADITSWSLTATGSQSFSVSSDATGARLMDGSAFGSFGFFSASSTSLFVTSVFDANATFEDLPVAQLPYVEISFGDNGPLTIETCPLSTATGPNTCQTFLLPTGNTTSALIGTVLTPTPEPATWALLAIGLLAVMLPGARRRTLPWLAYSSP
jgi:hypothetical protein